MKELSLLGVFFVAASGILLSPVEFTFPIIVASALVLLMLYFGNMPSGMGEAERRLQNQIDKTQKRLSEIESDINRKLDISATRIEVVEQDYRQHLTLNEQAIRGLTSTLEQRYVRLEHDFLKKIVRIEQRLKASGNQAPPSLSLLSAGLVISLAALIAIPLWWNFPFRHQQTLEQIVHAGTLESAPASQPDVRAQLRTPDLTRVAEFDELASLVQRHDEQLDDLRDLLASTIRPLEKCVNEISELSSENRSLTERYDTRVKKLESKAQECSSKLQVTQKIMLDQRRIYFGEG